MAQIRENIGKKGTTYTVRIRMNRKEATKTFRRKSDATKWAKSEETKIEGGQSA